MHIYQPYTYLIGWSTYNKWYYGVRFAKNCHPEELWVSYFTSSKHVKKFRKDYGEPDIIQVRKRFSDSVSARIHEEKVLVRMNVINEDKWLNKTNNKSIDSKIVSYNQRLRVKNGIHHFCGENNPSIKKMKNGTHPFLDGNLQSKISIKSNSDRLKNGTHNFKMNWQCPHCDKTGSNQINYIRWHGENCKKKGG